MRRVFVATLVAILVAVATVAAGQPDTLKSGRGFQILEIRGKKFFRHMDSHKAFMTLEEVASLAEVNSDSVKNWAFENRRKGFWRGEFTPLQSLSDWKVLKDQPITAVFYPTSESVDGNGFRPGQITPVVPASDTCDFNPVFRARPQPDTTGSLFFGELVEWMAFRTKSGYKCYPNCVLLYFNRDDWSLVDVRYSSEWAGTPFGIMWDCANTYRRAPQTPMVAEPPKATPPSIIVVPPTTEQQLPPPTPTFTPTKRFFLESAVWTGTIQSCQKSQIGQRYNYRLWLSGQESSLTYGEDHQTLLWLNTIAEYWQVSERNEGLSTNWSNNTGMQYFAGPQIRFFSRKGGVLKLAVTAGQRFAYNQQWTLLRPRINYERYALIGKKIGFQLEADAILSIKGPEEQVYFGNAGLFYSPKYRVKYWLGAEYTKVSAGNGGYASSGIFAVAKWEGAFGLQWLTLIGKYRPETTEVNHAQWNNPSKVVYTDRFEGIRWGVFAAVSLKR